MNGRRPRRRREIELLRDDQPRVLFDLVSPLGLRIVWARVNIRVFLFLADRWPWAAAKWARL